MLNFGVLSLFSLVSDDENVNPKDDTDASHGLQAKALYDYEAGCYQT